MQNIKHIIFDLGEVILNVKPTAVKEYMIDKGVGNVDELHLMLLDQDVYHKLETGKITAGEFRTAIRDIVDIPVTDDEIDEMVFELSVEWSSKRIIFNLSFG